MDIEITCRECGKSMLVAEEHRGQAATCPDCGAELVSRLEVPPPAGRNRRRLARSAAIVVGTICLAAIAYRWGSLELKTWQDERTIGQQQEHREKETEARVARLAIEHAGSRQEAERRIAELHERASLVETAMEPMATSIDNLNYEVTQLKSELASVVDNQVTLSKIRELESTISALERHASILGKAVSGLTAGSSDLDDLELSVSHLEDIITDLDYTASSLEYENWQLEYNVSDLEDRVSELEWRLGN